MPYYVGLDGCRAGWFAVTLLDHMSWNVGVFKNVEQIWKKLSHATLLLIDIPIGLCDSGKKGRSCDTAARRLLKGWRQGSELVLSAAK